MEEKMNIEETALQQAIFSSNPEIAIQQAKGIVSVIAKECKGPKFVSIIKGNKYPKVEWWATVGSSLSLSPFIVPDSVKPIIKDEKLWGYRARAEIRDIRFNPPKSIASAEACVTKEEVSWSDRDEHALESMAQTRAVSKAYRLCLPFIPVLAGLEATGAEEMTNLENSKPKKQASPSNKTFLTKEQHEKKKRISSWLLAEANNDIKNMSVILKSLTKDLYDSLDNMPSNHIELLWKRVEKDVLKFEETAK